MPGSGRGMFILGLTGSIGMGKTTAANDFRRLGVPVYDADAAVHDLLKPGGAGVEPVSELFPKVIVDGGVDRAALGRAVFGDDEALGRLEAILHPMVRARQNQFLWIARLRRAPLVVLDVPLLFETGGDRNCDAVAVVTAPAFLQRIRVLKRPGMTAEKLDGILARQMPDMEKRRRADFIIHTGLGHAFSLRYIRHIIDVTTTLETAGEADDHA